MILNDVEYFCKKNFLGHFSGCGVTGSVKKYMETVQYSSNPWNVQQQDEERPAYKYTRQAADKHHHGPVRTKRASKPKEERNTCSLFIQTDPLLWRHIKEQVNNSLILNTFYVHFYS